MERKQNDGFVEKFGWVRCFRCTVQFSRNQQMMVLTCRHTFCIQCFHKGCQLLDMNKKLAVCFECKKQGKCAKFNENLPEKFLKPFEKIGDSDMMRAARFQDQQWKWNLSNMSKKMNRKMDIMKQRQSQLAQKRASNMKLKQKHDKMYEELLKYWSRDKLEQLLSLPLDDLKTMDLSPERESPESASSSSGSSSAFSRSAAWGRAKRHNIIIDENSPTSLYRQVLMKNASSSSSHNTLNTTIPNGQRYNDVPFDGRPKNFHLQKVQQAEVRIAQPVFSQYRHQHRSQQPQRQQQQNTLRRPSGYGPVDGRNDAQIRYETQGGYHAIDKAVPVNEFNARFADFDHYKRF